MRLALRVLTAAVLLLVPVFWVGRVQSIDLASRSYNAWIAQLIRQGELPGLTIEPVLVNAMFETGFDLLLVWLPFPTAERVAMSITLLVFAGGMGLWLRAAAGGFRWGLAPLLLVASHGVVTQVGLVNFLLSLGFGGMAGAAILASGSLRWVGLPAALLAVVAHPAGATMVLAPSLYLLVARRLPGARQAWLFGAAVAGLVALSAAVTLTLETFRIPLPLASVGASTLLPFRPPYLLPASLYLALMATLLAAAGRAAGLRTVLTRPQAQVAFLTALACLLLPSGIRFPTYTAHLTYIDQRISLVVMLATLAWIGAQRLPRFAWMGSTLVALLYFGLLATDHRTFHRTDRMLRAAVLEVPHRSRVILPHRAAGYILDPLRTALDRACIGHCYSYLNYEPASSQFRIRATPGNEAVVSEGDRIGRFQNLELEIEERDLPLYQVVFERGEFTIRSSSAGERVRRVPMQFPSGGS